MNCSEGSRAATLCGFSIGVDAGVGAGMGALMATASAGAVTGVAFAILFPVCVHIESKILGKSTVIFPAIVAYGLSVGLTIGIFALAGASVAFGGIALAGLATAIIGVGIILLYVKLL